MRQFGQSPNSLVVRSNEPAPLAMPAPPAYGYPQPENEPSLFQSIFRNFWIVVIALVLAGGGAWVYLTQAEPLYTSQSKIYLEPSTPNVGMEIVTTRQREHYLQTQCEFIESTPILEIALAKLDVDGLTSFTEFDGTPRLYLKKYIETQVGSRDDIISVMMTTPHPAESQEIAAAIVDAYTEYQFQDRETTGSRLLETLQKKLATLVEEREALQSEIDEMRVINPQLGHGDNVIQQRLQNIVPALAEAEIDRLQKEAAYREGHPAVRKARDFEAELQEMFAERQAELANLNLAEHEYAKKTAQLTLVTERAMKLENEVGNLEISVDVNRRFNNVTVLEAADLPRSPSSPRKPRTLAVALAGGLILGCGLALLRDRMDGRLRSADEVQSIVGLPVLGVVPQMGSRRSAVARAMTVHLDPRSIVAEAYRTIRTAIYFNPLGQHAKTLLLTSPDSGDGKTTSASNLAIAVAQTGRNVLLLDADFRKPTQHKNLDIKDSLGLSSVLSGRCGLEEAIQHTGVEGLDILPCGPIPANPSEILNSREFGELVDQLAQRYDHILFDSPPVNVVTDARILGAVCDATILVLRADKSTRKAGEHARNSLLGVGAQILGAIVNDAPRGKGYDVYGGYYYGTNDVSGPAPVSTAGSSNGSTSAAARRLPGPSMVR